MKYYIFSLLLINVVSFIVAVADKKRALRKQWRIKEATLMLLAVVGGSVGMLMGLLLCNHKTRKKKFMVGIPIIIAVQTAIIALVLN